MSRIIKIADWSGPLRASVIFVHGLGGHPYDTWRRAPDDNTFWPRWLAQDLPGISVYSLAYEAPPTNWLGTSMALQDRAVNISEHLFGEPGLKTGPIVFICHSLGGLIVKQIMLDLQQQKERRPESADLLARVRQVVFAATPHTGARHATLLDRLRFFAWPSSVARTLVANDPTLRSINVPYRGLAEERRGALAHRVFYETQDTPLGVIVDEASADPGLPGDPPIPIDADHVRIVKPADRSSLLYARTRDFVAKLPISVEPAGALETLALPDVKSELPLNPIPKLIRLAAISVIGLIGYKGVQALITPPMPVEQIQKPLVEQLATKDAQIKALTDALLEKNPSALAPNAEQRVGGAVQSIAEGASEGDKRLQQALDLLKANKVAEASQLLAAVARDKTARAEQAITQAERDRKEAAVAYRNLGAIAGLRDPKSALEAYEKAASLDPDDIESLMWAGWIEIDHGDLSKAQARLERVLELAGKTNQPSYTYWARVGLGDIRQKRGALPDALKSYRDSLAIAERLAKADPGNAEWQRDLSVSHAKLANVYRKSGDAKHAREELNAGRAIIKKLVEQHRDWAQWKQDLAWFDGQLAELDAGARPQARGAAASAAQRRRSR